MRPLRRFWIEPNWSLPAVEGKRKRPQWAFLLNPGPSRRFVQLGSGQPRASSRMPVISARPDSPLSARYRSSLKIAIRGPHRTQLRTSLRTRRSRPIWPYHSTLAERPDCARSAGFCNHSGLVLAGADLRRWARSPANVERRLRLAVLERKHPSDVVAAVPQEPVCNPAP